MNNLVKTILIIVGIVMSLVVLIKLFGLVIAGSFLLALLFLISFIGNYK